ncbi:MAG TPA: flagellin [Terracidiphilus sp.]|nr:flagellin [Terracidiphilus sp.]
MSLGVLNNISAIYAQNNLSNTQAALQKTLQELSSGNRINSGADDAAGLSLADGLGANAAALQQSTQNASDGIGYLQVADGALSQVTSLLNRAVTLATEASNGTLDTNQLTAADTEFQNIVTEIGNIGSNTNFNSNTVFSATAVDFVTTDGTSTGVNTFAETVGALSNASVGVSDAAGGAGQDLSGDDLNAGDAAQALTDVTTAISDVALQRGVIGADINQLSAAANVASTQNVNMLSSQNNVLATDYGQATSDMSKYQILSQTGIAALSQAQQSQQLITKLLQ